MGEAAMESFLIGDGPTKVLVADDHPLFREAMQQVVSKAFSEAICLEARDLDTALQKAEQEEGLDLILLDLNMPGMNGFTGLISLRNKVPAIPIVIVSAMDERNIIEEATTYGASGFITKSMPREDMTRALHAVLAGEIWLPDEQMMGTGGGSGFDGGDADPVMTDRVRTLTDQQRRVLEMLVQGKSNKVIAWELSVAESTVKAHVSAILRKLQVTSRTQAVINAAKILKSLGV